ncbi:MAG: diguanylate cyclase [Desulfobacula sp.]|uniref:diguanylate cyclase n=1 Tax=Desulfobacula sp. TaxID=2593537 RepID=UPI002A079413|nr:diguanylate cyclase [Desulfobacula sp.]
MEFQKIDLKDTNITDIFRLEDLQQLQDAFSKANNIASTITDLEGNAITEPSSHTTVCALVRKTKKGLDKCRKSGRTLGLMSLKQEQPSYMKCQSLGFFDAAAPIVIGGIHMANWLIGQNCIGDVDEDRIVCYAEEIGADKEQMLQAFRQMTVISEEEFKQKLDFLWLLAHQIAVLSYRNLSYKKMVTLLEKSQLRLKEYKDNLEKTVTQRTRELTQALDEIKQISVRDGLTGCYNRRYINEHFPKEFSRAKRYKNPISIIMCDIDFFKKVNDTYGHQCGDYVLKEVALALQLSFRKDIDWVGRYGGEEFLIVLPFTSIRSAVIISERVKKAVQDLPLEYDKKQMSVTASFGVSGMDQWDLSEDLTWETILNSSDIYLYKAKDEGRNRIEFGPAMKK